MAAVTVFKRERALGKGVIAQDTPVEGLVVADGGGVEEATVERAAVVANGFDSVGAARVVGGPALRVCEVAEGIVAQPVCVVAALRICPGDEVDIASVANAAVETTGVKAGGASGVVGGPTDVVFERSQGVAADDGAVRVGDEVDEASVVDGSDVPAALLETADVVVVPVLRFGELAAGIVAQDDPIAQGREVDVTAVVCPAVEVAQAVGEDFAVEGLPVLRVSEFAAGVVPNDLAAVFVLPDRVVRDSALVAWGEVDIAAVAGDALVRVDHAEVVYGPTGGVIEGAAGIVT